MTILLYVLMIAAAIYAYKMRQNNLKKIHEQYGHLTAGGVAQQLGLTLHEGDPNLNLLLAFAEHAKPTGAEMVNRVFSASSKKETRIEMSGNPGGRDVMFVYGQKAESETAFRQVTTTRTLEFHLSTRVNAAFDSFEIFLRKPIAPGMEVKGVLAYPEQRFGDAELDSALVLRTNNPALGPALREIIRPLAKQAYLHLVGDEGYLSYLAGFNTSSYAVTYILEVAKAQAQIAQVFEAQRSMPVAAHAF